MNNLINIKNQKINENTLIELLFVFFPISFIIGNLVLSLNLLLFLILSLFVIKKNNIKPRFKKYYWFPIVFFSYLFINTYFQFKNELERYNSSNNIIAGIMNKNENNIDNPKFRLQFIQQQFSSFFSLFS